MISVRKIIQVIVSIPWVCCTSGNVSFRCSTTQFVSKVLSGGVTCVSSNFGHQVMLLELVTDVTTWWHYLH